ncbi:hypothetical protein BDB01DRAFT_714441 [Pilobolus umbonatus]|nr:hypothetical protein BDB01DRAFT_714441 [Pilobolus umbonatus]
MYDSVNINKSCSIEADTSVKSEIIHIDSDNTNDSYISIADTASIEYDIDDKSSVDSLQSDDDVLGPWIELGLINSCDDSTDTIKNTLEYKSVDCCSDCVDNNDRDSDPFHIHDVCESCKNKWKSLGESVITKIKEEFVKTKKKVKMTEKISVDVSSENLNKPVPTALPPNKQKNAKSTLLAITGDNAVKIRPAISQHSQKTNRKMANVQDTSFFTTGAFMTRKTAKQLADPVNGFRPNPYNFKYKQIVEVLNINGHWYRGVLERMDQGKVKVRYSDWDNQEEWIIMGSRRLRVVEQKDDVDITNDIASKQSSVDSIIDILDDTPIKIEDDVAEGILLEKTIIPVIPDSNPPKALSKEDPSHIFYDNEVYMTRRTARELVDEHGFRPNSYGYRQNKAVAVKFYSRSKSKQEHTGYLQEMRFNQVRVWYPDLYQSEWLSMDSRRLRIMSEEEEESILFNDIHLAIEEPSAAVGEKKEETGKMRKSLGRPRKNNLKSGNNNGVGSLPSPTVVLDPKPKKDTPVTRVVDLVNEDECNDMNFLTTGAFATRKAMRQLKDQNGFTPNPYGYSFHQAVEVLNIRSGKNKFWERGVLVAMKPGQVRVHFDGWTDQYDEWIMVGSRRIRLANDTVESSSSKKMRYEFLLTELNPELKDESKKNRKRLIVTPDDYHQMGLLENIEEVKQDMEKTTENRKRTKVDKKSNAKKRAKANPQQSTRDISPAHNHFHSCGPKDNNEQLSKSNRIAQANAAKDHAFVANVYGYDYMQHVTVLHLDKRLYEGRLVSMHKNKVKVHYCGWLDAFDEYITLGSRRLQPMENDHTVECLEPDYRQRYELLIKDNTPQFETEADTECLPQSKRRARQQITQDDVQYEDDVDLQIEYHKDEYEPGEEVINLLLLAVIEMDTWKVYCNQCNIVIKQFRYYCTYCETPSAGYDYQSFELCLRCFDHNFPFWHEHPRSSFAIQAVIDAEIGPMPIKGELVNVWEEDVLDRNNQKNDQEDSNIDASKIFTGEVTMDKDEGYRFLKRWKRRKVCAFCNDDEDTSNELGEFIGPFVIATYNKNGVEKKRSFWAHDACARYSPEVFCTPEGKWYNVTLALKRGRGMRCYSCKEKGATIGCFESKCSKSFHLPCSQKPVSYFKSGVIFWCSVHEAYYNKIDTYVNIFNCDGCNKKMDNESWFTCVPCASNYFSSFDLCSECFDKFPADHPHTEDDFEETSIAIIKEMEAQKATKTAKAKEDARVLNAQKKKKPLFPRKKRRLPDGTMPISCCYCGTYEADNWRKGYDGGVIMCDACFNVALLIDNDGQPCNNELPLVVMDVNDTEDNKYIASIEDYSHKPYFTRDTVSASKFSDELTGSRLASYEPQPNQLFSLTFDSTYFDIPGRAPRWASHSGTDYHGTWLPQTVRRALLKYTSKDERVLSNFLGRGTDAIECFILQRRCCGVDINPAAVTLSQRNCCFEIPPGLTSAEYRPIVAQADSRNLTGALFGDESFHHVLSHPPYKDCVAYSTHLDGDLSRFTSMDDFGNEYRKVVMESYRLLKMSRNLTLGIGDNREHCFYIPVGFRLMRIYVEEGFEMEELIIKRQRYCSAFGLGTYLCVQFDFLVFTHEFIATFKKIPKGNIDLMHIKDENPPDVSVILRRTQYGIPSSAISRKSVVMGTVWVFKPTETARFDQLCISRMVERFGKDDSNWEHIQLDFTSKGEAPRRAIEPEDDIDNPLSEYEKQRLKRIEENNQTLLKLGLISELSEESGDTVHYETMMGKKRYNDAELALIAVGHQTVECDQINLYRQQLVNIALEAADRLCTKGMLIIGTQDIRNYQTGKLWPMSMLILEDIEAAVDSNILKLKEMVVTVPDGYSKDRKKPFCEVDKEDEQLIDIETVDDYVPIVHAIYLIFQKIA